MAWIPVGYKALIEQLSTYSSMSIRTLSSASGPQHWAGGTFVPTVTGTITKFGWCTGSFTGFTGGLTAAITQLDSSGLPLGADISAATERTTGGGTLAANTTYTETVSASVTAGTEYGAIVRMSSFTAGSAGVGAAVGGGSFWAISRGDPYRKPITAYQNTASVTRSSGPLAFDFLYSGDVRYPIWGAGHCGPSTTGASGQGTGTTIGNCAGNRFFLPYAVKVVALAASVSQTMFFDIGLFAGSDNTPITGSLVTSTDITVGTSGVFVLPLAEPLILLPGTYRVAIKARNTVNPVVGSMSNIVCLGSSNTDYQINFGSVAVGQGANSLAAHGTTYASGSWTNTTNRLNMITPIISHIDGGAYPNFALGI